MGQWDIVLHLSLCWGFGHYVLLLSRKKAGTVGKRTLTRSSTRHTNSALAEQIENCHNAACHDIENTIRRGKAWNDLKNTKHISRWKAGTCAICGEYMEYCITNYHAGLHGYKSAEAMIKAGKVIFD